VSSGNLISRRWEGPLRLLRWVLCQLLPVWLCCALSAVSSAAAASDEDAPMCDPHGASVAAPAEVPEVDRGKLEELPCDALWLWIGAGLDLSDFDDSAVARNGTPPPAPELQLDRERPEGVIEGVGALPARSDERGLPDLGCTGLPPRSGHRLGVFRPPVSSR
jgi:hypothetical protein